MNSLHHEFKTLRTWCTVKCQSLQMMPVVECHPKSNALQKRLPALSVWAKKWQVSFSVSNRKVVHGGKNRLKHICVTLSVTLLAAAQDRDLGVIVDRCLQSLASSAEAAKKPRAILGIIRKGPGAKTRGHHFAIVWNFGIPPSWALCAVLVPVSQERCSGVKYICVCVCRYNKNDLRAGASALRGQMKRQGLLSLESRKLWGDMSKVYTIVKGIVWMQSWYSPNSAILEWGERSLQLVGDQFKIDKVFLTTVGNKLLKLVCPGGCGDR